LEHSRRLSLEVMQSGARCCLAAAALAASGGGDSTVETVETHHPTKHVYWH
jgi:hypothetical protein